jgi:ssDNA-binding Zn-finger/Zn-ribbon topoisomerase 1
MKATKKAGWPKAHEVHSPENRIGQAWTQNKVLVFDNNNGTVKKKPLGHFACPKCDFVVEIDSRTYAFCPKCGDIFNDSPVNIIPKISNRERKRQDEKLKYDCCHKSM